jgi:hypothetical protein
VTFIGQRAHVPVTGEQASVARQLHDAADRSFQLGVIRIRQISPTDRAADESSPRRRGSSRPASDT